MISIFYANQSDAIPIAKLFIENVVGETQELRNKTCDWEQL